ncbi:MAG TPA: YdeI/OmpD-associated family protein [Chloroflexota bacterium]|nr:YdeI/OmpD-associated family protein [Chloroflexota bacterium]
MQFRTTIQQSGKTATGIRVPDEVVAALGAGKRPPVRVTINGCSYRSTVAVMGGAFMIALNADNRAVAGVAGGDTVDVDLEVDTAPREVSVPADLDAALNGDPEARRFFDGLSYSNKLRHVLAIEAAKTDDTRQRRIAKSVDMFRAGRA